ncbi:hypothetical protein ACLB2K_019525 [Fragaria x ananassa]
MNSELSQSTDSEKEEQAPQHSNAKGKSVAKRKRAEKKTKSTTSLKHTKLRSWVWMHFTKEEHPLTEIVNGKEEVVGHTTRAQCKYCNTHLAANSNANGTSSLMKHIEQSCKGYPGRDDEEKGQTHLSRDGQDDSSGVGFRHWSKDACVEAATVMIVMDELPFSAIERPGFKHFCSVAVPKWKPLPCRKVIVKNFLAMYASKKEELKMELENHCKSKSSTEVGSGSSSGRDSQKIYGKVADMLADWEQVLENDESVVVSNEVDRYLLDPTEKPKADKKKEEFQLLLWWKLNGSKYPNLAVVAKDVLAIQVSTVASESSFSTGKRVIDPHRSSLTPKSVEALICLQNWLKSDSITNLAYVPTPKEMAWLEAVEEEQEKEDHEKKNKEQEASEAAASKSTKIAKSSSVVDVSKTYKKSSGNHPELKYVETGIHGGNKAGKSGINMMKSIVFVFQS